MKNVTCLLALCLGLGACSTASLQNEAARLAAINTIICAVDAKAQPILVPLAATVTVAVDPLTAPAIAGAVALDGTLHAALQAACPMNTMLLGGLAAPGAVPAAAPTDTTATVKVGA